MAERVTGRPYGRLLRRFVFRPLGLAETSFPRSVALPRPFIHGYVTDPPAPPEDVSTLINPSGAWASGGIVSTPRDVGDFFRGYLGGRLFDAALQRRQLRFVARRPARAPQDRDATRPASRSSATAPRAARCTGIRGASRAMPSSPPPVATAPERSPRSLNIPPPSGELLARLRAMQTTAICLLLR